MGTAMDRVSRWLLGMGSYSHSFLLLGVLLLTLLIGCDASDVPTEDDPRGELLFMMECQWGPSHIWRCDAEVDNKFVEGRIALALMDKERLAFCGEDLITYTGHDLYDTLVVDLTDGRFSCVFVRENVSGNEFDWIWNSENNELLMIWRPVDASNKHVTLAIDAYHDEKKVDGWVYYREEN